MTPRSESDEPSTEHMITVHRTHYARLLRASEKLAALEAAGVDNWSGYDLAMEILYGEDNDE